MKEIKRELMLMLMQLVDHGRWCEPAQAHQGSSPFGRFPISGSTSQGFMVTVYDDGENLEESECKNREEIE